MSRLRDLPVADNCPPLDEPPTAVPPIPPIPPLLLPPPPPLDIIGEGLWIDDEDSFVKEITKICFLRVAISRNICDKEASLRRNCSASTPRKMRSCSKGKNTVAKPEIMAADGDDVGVVFKEVGERVVEMIGR